MVIIFATNNEHKIKEISNILGNTFSLLKMNDVNISEEIPENYPTLEENALYKAQYIHNATGMNVFADDTGFEIDALEGKPGVHSARFAGENKDSQANIEKVMELMKGIANRKARFRTVIALIVDKAEYIFEGIIEGAIIDEKRGTEGFGYDPIFIPDGNNLTFAEMTLDEKNKISHRAKAFDELKKFLSNYSHPGNKEIS